MVTTKQPKTDYSYPNSVLNKPGVYLDHSDVLGKKPFLFKRKDVFVSGESKSARIKDTSVAGLVGMRQKNKIKGLLRGMSSMDILNYTKARHRTESYFK